MPEQQNIEYKQSWHDETLKWVCGFANNCACVETWHAASRMRKRLRCR
jgi:hypothetical protein